MISAARRMLVIASEDIGLAYPQCAAIVKAMRRQRLSARCGRIRSHRRRSCGDRAQVSACMKRSTRRSQTFAQAKAATFRTYQGRALRRCSEARTARTDLSISAQLSESLGRTGLSRPRLSGASNVNSARIRPSRQQRRTGIASKTENKERRNHAEASFSLCFLDKTRFLYPGKLLLFNAHGRNCSSSRKICAPRAAENAGLALDADTGNNRRIFAADRAHRTSAHAVHPAVAFSGRSAFELKKFHLRASARTDPGPYQLPLRRRFVGRTISSA